MSSMSLFNSPYLLFATLSLTLQAIVMLLLLYGYWLKRKAKFVQHAQVMTTALILHLALIFTIMLPALILALVPIFVIPHLFELTSLVTLAHASLGAVAVSLGLWLVLSWRRSGGLEGCFKRRKIMLVAISVWLAALFFGFALYTILYWAALMG
jgi:uncharacterized membrane protein YozB (DUF420 family)